MELPHDPLEHIIRQPTPSRREAAPCIKERQGQIPVQLGVAFRNLNVFGTSSSDEYQKTIVSYVLDIPKYLVRLFSWRETSKSHILRDFSGLVNSGDMVLVLGRPGSGCSTFLKVLAGETRGLNVDDVSKISYDGISYPQMHKTFKGDCVYLAELDVHFSELTLDQTLTFAAAMRGAGSDKKSEARTVAKEAASSLNLHTAFDTKIGNSIIRGLSGGEKRRTSIAEVIISGAQFQCWDNSTRGLDSSTALGFVQLTRQLTTKLRSTALMSMYQVSDTMYKHFDKVILLYEGHQIYFGPASLAADYFIDIGFERPARATIADFLTSLSYPAERRAIRGFENRVPHSAEEFADCWKRSAAGKALLQEIDQSDIIYKRQSGIYDNFRYKTLTYLIPIRVQIWLCIRRGLQRLRNNYVPIVAGVIANTIIAIVVGSVYYNLGENTDMLDKRSVLIFFSLMINAYAPAFEIMAMWAQRPIVEKHNRYSFYHPFTESCASLVCDLPNKLATCVMFNTTLYFMTNLRRTANAFFTYLIFIFITILTMSMFFRMVGSLSRTIEQTMVPVSTMILLFSAYTGFIIPVKDMVPWLSWFRRLNPIAFAYESLMINEFAGRQFSCSRLIPTGPSYTEELEGKVCAAIGSHPGRFQVDGLAYIRSKYGFEASHLWRNIGIILSMLMVLFVVHLLATECIPAQRSRGEILLFQRRSKACGEKIKDEEAGRRSDLSSSDENSCGQTLIQKRIGIHGNEEDRATFHWSNTNYTIKAKNEARHILKDNEGWVKPGSLTALMGVTGAGKTSLLDILACRTRSGVVTGDIFIGNQQCTADFQRKAGYVQQEDIHLPTLTVREALEFSAKLRHSDGQSSSEHMHYVQHVINILDMGSYAEAVIGVAGEGLNVEQRKRLSIAVEMVAKPELLLFLDEPTSGLDSQTAWSICMLLRKLAENGQAILVTIHQPSSQLFHIFDRLLLLDRTGKMLYFGDIGPESLTLINYFEKHGATACKSGQNPAAWILDVTGHSEGADGIQTDPPQDWCEVWARSDERQKIVLHLDGLKERAVDTNSQTDTQVHQYAASFLCQLYLVTKRVFQDYWRDPVYLYSKAALCAGMTLCNGLSFYNTRLDIQGVSNIFFSVFLFTQLFSTIDQQVIPRLTSGKALFEARERRSKTYSWVAMIFAHVVVELFWQTVVSLLIFITWWYPTGLYQNHDPSFGASERSGLAFSVIWLFNLWISTFSQTVGVGLDHDETAVQIATLFFWLSLVFCGVLVPPKDLPNFWTFVYRASPITYFIDGTITAALSNMQIHCSNIEFLHIDPLHGETCGEYLTTYLSAAGGYLGNVNATSDCLYCPVSNASQLLALYSVDFRTRWHNVGYLTAYVVFNILATFTIYWVRRERRAKV